MKLVDSQNRIITLMSGFVKEIEYATSMGKTDFNKTAETILIPLLNEVYGWSLKNINYAEDNNNFPGIDLADEAAGISIQVTATPTLEKVKHTLEQFIKHSQYLTYNRLIIYILTRKQNSYSATAIRKIIQNRFDFDPQKDIWDCRNILKEVSNFQIDKALRVQEILEANFSEDKSPSVSLVRELEQKTDWQQICRGMLPIELDTNPLIAGDGVKLGVGDIVPLDLVERKERPKPTRDPSPENSQQALEDQEIPLPYNQFFDHVLTGCRSFNQQGKGVAIIGEPGAGKTTLLCAIAYWIIEQGDLPIFVSLQNLEAVSLENLILEVWLKDALRKREAPKPLQNDLVEQYNAGRVWLLLDGIDEIAQSDRFFSVFAREFKGWIADARVVLTCRVNIWEANRNDLRPRFEVYRSRGFNDEEQLSFIQNFFAKANQPETGSKLIQELENAPLRLKDLIKTPLWLTLVCRIWKRGKGNLPETKAELYRQFTETFYDKNKPYIPEEKRPLLERALGEMAKKAIDREEFRFRLRETFIRQELDKFDSSLFGIACELGWLNKLGSVENPYELVYAFLHPTFQEYFAALAIEDWDDFLPRNHVDRPTKNRKGECKYRIFEPQWKEVILLWIGQERQIGIEKNEDFITTLIGFEDGCGNFYYSNVYLLAAFCTLEYPKSSYVSVILRKFIWLSLGFGKLEIRDELSISPIEAKEFLKEVNNDFLVETLEDLLEELDKIQSTEDESEPCRKLYIAELLDSIASKNQKIVEIIDRLISQIDISRISNSLIVVLTLKNLSTRYSKAARLLLNIFNEDDDSFTRLTIISTLSENEKFCRVDDLVKQIDSCNNFWLKETLLKSLYRRDPNNETIINTLASLLLNGNSNIFSELDFFLNKEEILKHPKIISTLSNLLHTYNDEQDIEFFKECCALYLGKAHIKDQNIISMLIEIRDNSWEEYKRFKAAKTLFEMGVISKEDFSETLFDFLFEFCEAPALGEVAESLSEIHPHNWIIPKALLDRAFDKRWKDEVEWFIPSLEKILRGQLLPIAVTVLKNYLIETASVKGSDIYRHVNRLLCHCARKMTYPDFYQAWHSSSSVSAELSVDNGEIKL